MVRVTIGLSAESTKSNLTSHWLAVLQFFLQLTRKNLSIGAYSIRERYRHRHHDNRGKATEEDSGRDVGLPPDFLSGLQLRSLVPSPVWVWNPVLQCPGFTRRGSGGGGGGGGGEGVRGKYAA